MEKKIIFIRIFGLLLCVVIMLAAFSYIFRPKRLSFPYDITRKIKGFYEEPENSLDIVFIGSSELFSTMNPAILWTEQGITSYVFAANEQNLSLSYYYIKEALKYQSPQAIVLEMSYCNFGVRQRDSVVRINLDDMKWGINKMEAIINNVPASGWFSHFFHLEKYHDRWKEISANDLEWYRGRNPYKGWSPFGYSDDDPLGDASTSEVIQLDKDALFWLNKIMDYCNQQNVELIFLKTPNGNKICLPAVESDGYDNAEGQPYYNAVQQIADENDISFLNFNLWMEGKKHNDVATSTKISSEFGKWYAETHKIVDKRDDIEYAYWDEDVAKGYEFINGEA